MFPLIHSKPLLGQQPFELYQRIASPTKQSFLLESGKGPRNLARYSFLGSDPYLAFSGTGMTHEIRTQGTVTHGIGDPLQALFEHLHHSSIPRSTSLPPFIGGAVGFFSYDCVRQFECLPTIATNDLRLPDMEFLFVDLFAAIDHATDMLHLIFTPSPERLRSESHDALLREGKIRIAEFEAKLSSPPNTNLSLPLLVTPRAIHANQSRADYVQRVLQCQEYIGAGDIYQANISHRFSIDLDQSTGQSTQEAGHALYAKLRKVNPSPFSALLTTDRLTLVSSSPERLIELRGNQATTRPIAGTRPRGRSSFEDQQFSADLLANKKERAEHLMLVDLARNDLGRVCEYGSVQVDEFMTVEQYSHVAHLVSDVGGTLRPTCNAQDLIKSIFPGGTITGVPKIRCMEIIEELEPVRRGPYTGSIGYLSWTGDMDFNIIIRTLLLSQDRAYLQVGAGIVADSQPQREYEETMQKAQALFQALRESPL
ncbi:anthranilate synthase component I family protein [Candidatus Nitronereus thalassa]|uniref:Anthranilate synthase component I family protein n=1 Tax=Candidatus Nitronereus thalassa TaxID=3020898 RepID=A0ABU3K9Z2_9BACT|nr:anthranilate synthase component I family protein [Candidatus Nitronereus thalassa]MDT7043241.1 anthranilate synthase component I family protein [Candidatus Nitronereus thalassa]